MNTLVNTFLGEMNTMNTFYQNIIILCICKVSKAFTNRLKVFTEVCTIPATSFKWWRKT